MKSFIIPAAFLLLLACSGQPSTTEIVTVEEKSTLKNNDKKQSNENLLFGEWQIETVKKNGINVDLKNTEKTALSLKSDGTGTSSNKNSSILWKFSEEGGKKTLSLAVNDDDKISYDILGLEEKKMTLKNGDTELVLIKK